MISGSEKSFPLLSSLLSIGETVISVPLAYGIMMSLLNIYETGKLKVILIFVTES